AVEHRHRRRPDEADLVGGTLDDGSDADLAPVLPEYLGHEALDGVAGHGDIGVLGEAAVHLAHHTVGLGHGAHRIANRPATVTAARTPPAGGTGGAGGRGAAGMAGGRAAGRPPPPPRRARGATTTSRRRSGKSRRSAGCRARSARRTCAARAE